MKAIIYLAGLIAIGVVVTWLAFDITPQNQWYWVKGYVTNTSSKISDNLTDTTNSASKLKGVLNERFDEAKDVYEGKGQVDPFEYNPTNPEDIKVK